MLRPSRNRNRRKQAKGWQKPFFLLDKQLGAIAKSLVKWLLHRLLAPRRNPLFAKSGFVLPVAAIVLLFLSLFTGLVLFRSSARSIQVIGERQEQVIYNAATPAIDRAKAKLEYLFLQDPRFPGGLPSDNVLEGMLLNNGANGVTALDIDSGTAGNQNPYDLPSETRLDLDNNGNPDNAWSFEIDTNGDGETETVAYSILLRTFHDNGTPTNSNDDINRSSVDTAKGPKLVVRNGPINLNVPTNSACDGSAPEQGWDTINGATVRRAFQVTALVVDDNNGANRSVTTLEMQQDRQADRGSKWGAWFRYDLEIFPGPDFRWNGAMHTEGNFIVGDSANFRAFLVSSPSSCLYTRQNSEITIGGSVDRSTPPFLGHMITGSMKRNSHTGSSQIDIYAETASGIQTKTIATDNDSTSSNNASSSAVRPADLSLDPVVLYTTNQNQARGSDANNGTHKDDTNWLGNAVVREGRIYNTETTPPYVDDTYRADNRYGPKPTYSKTIRPFENPDGTPTGRVIGDTIVSSGTGADPNGGILTNLDTTDPETVGLDGYWERRAWAQGLRVIVGQRLELGNRYNWRPDGTDPLYPPNPSVCTGSRCHEQKQWKTLRDNLAAVQSAAVYHQASQSGNFPVACLAATAHPGTRRTDDAGTVGQSTIFNKITVGGSEVVITDFLNGVGTNGWEFNGPANVTNETSFASAINDTTDPLRVALANLAHFAGDGAPDGKTAYATSDNFGAFPPRQDTRDSNNTNDAVPSFGPAVHPYPLLSMWGDFSNLRRTIQLLNTGTTYANLSLADKATLHTAACTLGMLAYNLDGEEDFYSNNSAALISLNNDFLDDYDDDPAPEDRLPISLSGLRADINSSSTLTSTQKDTFRLIFDQIVRVEQINRDRVFGFKDTPGTIYRYRVHRRGSSGAFEFNGTNYGTGSNLNLRFDYRPGTGNNYFGFGPPTSRTQEERFIRLAQAANNIIPPTPKYPSLYYLFPVYDHDHDGGTVSPAVTLGSSPVSYTFIITIDHAQPSTEPYIADRYIFNSTSIVTDDVNHGYTYKALEDVNSNSTSDLEEIKILPRARSSWQLPNTTTLVDSATLVNRANIIRDGTTNVGVTFLDKGMFNGREMMSVRALDVDLDLLRTNTIGTGTNVDSWLPYRGIVYAFREDAVREDGIARPRRNVAWTSCDSATEIQTADCRMDAVSSTPSDPPLNVNNNISPKPVDFHADPDRRPHGFRLRNGIDLRRPSLSTSSDFFLTGLAFISDNPMYVVGDNLAFNLHRDKDALNTRIEEFTITLNDDWNNFYSRGSGGTNGTLNSKFAHDGDTWRPAEIIADAITLISPNFVDGSIAEGTIRANVNGQTSSYRTLNAPSDSDSARRWVREDGSVSDDVNNAVPIKISRNGYPVYCINTAGGADVTQNNTDSNFCQAPLYQEQEFGRESQTTTPAVNGRNNRTFMGFSADKTRINAPNDTRMNLTIVSGIVPSRGGQSFGGLHNFPRFIEDWNGDNLFLSGSFIQLNFSTYATAPFDQDSWEPGNTASTTDETIPYYSAPNRRWGYDVGLQYAPAGPVARRFVTPSITRSEFYRELPIDDSYVTRLRCARRRNSSNGWESAGIDPSAGCS